MSLNLQNKSGFTLIEVLISMAVLIFISFAIFQATTQTYRLRDILLTEGDFYNGIRLAMNIVEKDVSMIYSPSLMAPTPKSSPSPSAPGLSLGAPFGSTGSLPTAIDRETQNILSSELGQVTQFWLGANDKTGIRVSRFIGSDSKMSFIALSHLRIYKDTAESEFAKISYELVKDDTPGSTPDTLTLIKTENSDAFNPEDQKSPSHSRSYKLLRGIKNFKLTYYKKDGKIWKNYSSWDNEREDFKKEYPDIIELTVTVVGPSRLSFEGKYKFRPEIPLRGLNPST